MSVFFNNALAGASGQGGGAYEIERSVRFNSADSAYLSRTPASAGNRKTWTWAGWVKLSNVAVNNTLFAADGPSSDYFILRFASTGTINIISVKFSALNTQLNTLAVYRDPSAWYHVVLRFDATQALGVDRVKVYVNGVEQTLSGTFSSQNVDQSINATTPHYQGVYVNTNYFNGYLADVHFVDGQALDPTSFGEFDTNGVWQPKAYSGSYGSQGWRLDFSDNSAATATTLGKDRSPNGNNWTPNNLSVTAGAGNDSLVDSPTNYGSDTGAGGQVRGNYCTWNPLAVATSNTFANGNLDITVAQTTSARGTFGLPTGKWYWEVVPTNAAGHAQIGICGASNVSNTPQGSVDGWTFYQATGEKFNNAVSGSYGSAYAQNNIIGVAVDLDAGKIWWSINGTWQASGNPATGANAAYSNVTGPVIPVVSTAAAGGSHTFTANFGQRPFAYTAPSGFKALCTQNLPTSTITKGSSAMDVVLYTGTGAALTPTSTLGFSPDFVWIKGRSGATDHALYDTVRGATIDLASNSTAAETTQTQGLTAFNSNGFSVGTLAKVNTNTATYAAWSWDAGSSTVTNTSGSISSQVRANASAGFSIVTYTGTGANATVGHGLGVGTRIVIVKRRNTTGDWRTYHGSVGATKYLDLNATNAASTDASVWNNTEPTSLVFSVGTDPIVNAASSTYVAYCFAPVAGYSAFGSYVGNGSADGPMVYTGFRPRWVMIKCSSTTGDWQIFDSARDPDNAADSILSPNYAIAENTGTARLDLTGNGFKLRITGSDLNTSAATYIYAAFAENPFSLARAR